MSQQNDHELLLVKIMDKNRMTVLCVRSNLDCPEIP